MEVVFWLSALLLAYAYVGYPLLLEALSRLRPRRRALEAETGVHELPTVSLIICAHNEEAVLRERLRNALASDYPRERLEIIVASDGSTDRTDEIAAEFAPAVSLLRYPRLGKTAVICRTVPRTRGEIVLLSDANVFPEPGAVRQLVERLAEPGVGVAFGNLVLLESDGRRTSRAEGLYWRYETRLKELESQVGSCFGVTGALWAFWKHLFVPFPDHIASDDFVLPLKITLQGYRTVLEKTALVYEYVPRDDAGAFRRKAQCGSGGLQALLYLRELWNPFASRTSLYLWSHKVLRWLTLPLLAVFCVANTAILSGSILYQATFALLILTLSAALWGAVPSLRRHTPRVLLLPFYFYSLNLAIAAGFLRYGARKHSARWERLASER